MTTLPDPTNIILPYDWAPNRTLKILQNNWSSHFWLVAKLVNSSFHFTLLRTHERFLFLKIYLYLLLLLLEFRFSNKYPIVTLSGIRVYPGYNNLSAFQISAKSLVVLTRRSYKHKLYIHAILRPYNISVIAIHLYSKNC